MDSAFEDFDKPKEGYITRRIVAGLIDYTLILGLTYTYVTIFGQPIENGFRVTGLAAFGPMLIWFLLTVFLEILLGATIGNGIAGLKPVPLHGRPVKISLKQSFLRHLADPIDMFPFGLVGILTIKNSNNKQRLGDIWAGSVVIRKK
jgi:uncharacterized RDD family membrane protein YckC